MGLGELVPLEILGKHEQGLTNCRLVIWECPPGAGVAKSILLYPQNFMRVWAKGEL